MYSKIYKELFVNGYRLKKHLKDNIWVVKILTTNYYLFVYRDYEYIEGFKNYHEAELVQYSDIYFDNVVKRLEENRKFLHLLQETRRKQPYLFEKCQKKKQEGQASLFTFDSYVV